MDDAFPVGSGLRRTKVEANEANEVTKGTAAYATAGVAERPHKRDISLGPTARMQVRATQDPAARSARFTLGLIGLVVAMTCVFVVLLSDTTASQLPRVIFEVATLERVPWTAQDNVAAALAIALGMLPLLVLDVTVCSWLRLDAGARWFLLHALGNLVVAALSLPDFYYASKNPQAIISVDYCRSLPFPGCSDWPTTVIISMHAYHMVAFRLSADDLFHHLCAHGQPEAGAARAPAEGLRRHLDAATALARGGA